MTILILADHDDVNLKDGTYRAVTAASQLGTEIHIVVVGSKVSSIVNDAAKISGVKKVFYAEHPQFKHSLAEYVSPFVSAFASTYTYLMAPSTTTMKNSMPRVAALLNVPMLSDVIAIESNDEFIRPMYAGNVLAKVRFTQAGVRVMTVRQTAFERAETVTSTAECVAVSDIPVFDVRANHVRDELTVSDRPDLSSAKVIVAGGRGLKSADNFKHLSSLADQLGAAVGASRAAVDAGFAPNDYQIGQTGKMVAPDLYFAIGISGAIQHIAGMKDSKVIVAINNDPEAPIFDVADYGLVGDLFTILPELEAALKKVP